MLEWFPDLRPDTEENISTDLDTDALVQSASMKWL